jgi:hypothetical protein
MSQHQQAALSAAKSAQRFAGIIAGIGPNATLNPVIHQRALDEEARLKRLFVYLSAMFARGDNFPGTAPTPVYTAPILGTGGQSEIDKPQPPSAE